MDVRDKVLGSIDREALVKLCQDLIRVPSTTGQEQEFAKFFGQTLEGLGMSVTYVEGVRHRPNVIGKLKGTVGKPVLLLLTHMDTVRPGKREDWSVDPYGGKVREGRIYGRGAFDAKSGIAAMISAVKAVVDSCVKLEGDVLLLGSVGEEDVEPCGMPYVMDNYVVPNLRPDMAIYTHPREELEIKAYFKSLTWWTLVTIGKIAHGGTPHKGVNAIEKMIKVIQAIREKGLFYSRHPVLGDCTIAFTTITATPNQYNTIPDSCTTSLNARLVPGQTVESVKAEIEQIIMTLKDGDPNLKADVQLMYGHNPVEIQADEPILKAARKAVDKVTGKPPMVGGVTGAGELWFALRRGIPGISLGPGGGKNIHGADESIDLDQVETIAKVYALIILDVCRYLA